MRVQVRTCEWTADGLLLAQSLCIHLPFPSLQKHPHVVVTREAGDGITLAAKEGAIKTVSASVGQLQPCISSSSCFLLLLLLLLCCQ